MAQGRHREAPTPISKVAKSVISVKRHHGRNHRCARSLTEVLSLGLDPLQLLRGEGKVSNLLGCSWCTAGLGIPLASLGSCVARPEGRAARRRAFSNPLGSGLAQPSGITLSI